MLLLFSKKLKKIISVDNPVITFLKSIVYITVVFFCFVFLFMISEGVTLEESFWQTWQTLTTVGYGNRPAETLSGRLITVIFGTLGIAFLGVLFSSAFDLKFHFRMKRRLGLVKNPIKNGYVLFNYPGEEKLLNFIQEIRSVEPDIGVCIVDNKIQNLPELFDTISHIHFIKGSNLDKTTYENANLRNNKTIVVFPVESSIPESDGATKTTVDLISSFVDKKTKIMHVLVDQRNSWMFENTPSIQVYENLEMLVIVQECQDDYSAKIMGNLLLNTKGANPLTVIPKKSVGLTWGEFTKKSNILSNDSKTLCNPFVLIKKGEVNTCPKSSDIIEAEDKISIITYNDFDWVKFEDEIIKL